MSKSVNFQLTRPFTWAGKNYSPGAVELPEAGANYAARRKFGTIAGGSATTTETGAPGGTEKTGTEGGNNTEGGLPEDFPMRHVFDKAGFKSVAEVQAKSR